MEDRRVTKYVSRSRQGSKQSVRVELYCNHAVVKTYSQRFVWLRDLLTRGGYRSSLHAFALVDANETVVDEVRGIAVRLSLCFAQVGGWPRSRSWCFG